MNKVSCNWNCSTCTRFYDRLMDSETNFSSVKINTCVEQFK